MRGVSAKTISLTTIEIRRYYKLLAARLPVKSVDRLWTPWRFSYIAQSDAKEPYRAKACIFCSLRDSNEDETNFVVHRGAHNFIVLNIFPYTNGHLMIAPYAHLADLDALSDEAAAEMIRLAKQSQTTLREAYHPHGFNLGMNLGSAAGAGVADHIHLHILPRWLGDANFMTTVGETRVLPEELTATYRKLRGKF
jgi:ATP adenylyltransferase